MEVLFSCVIQTLQPKAFTPCDSVVPLTHSQPWTQELLSGSPKDIREMPPRQITGQGICQIILYYAFKLENMQ